MKTNNSAPQQRSCGVTGTWWRSVWQSLVAMMLVVTASAEELTVITDIGAGTEPEVTFAQVAVPARIRLVRTSPAAPLNVVLLIGQTTLLGATPNLAVVATNYAGPFTTGIAGDDYVVEVLNSLGVPLAAGLQPVITPPTAFSPALCTVTIPAGQLSLSINFVPLSDTLMEGGEQILVRPQNNPVAYAIGNPGSASVYITDGDQSVAITSIDPRADELVTTSSPVPTLGTYGSFQIDFVVSPGVTNLNDPGNPGYPVSRTASFTLSGDAAINEDYWLLASPSPLTPGALAPPDCNVRLALGPNSFEVDQLRAGAPFGTVAHNLAVGQLIIIGADPQTYLITAIAVGTAFTPGPPVVLYTPDVISIFPAFSGTLPTAGTPITILGQRVGTLLLPGNINTITFTNIPEALVSFFISVVPIDDNVVEGGENVRLQIRTSNDFIIQSPGDSGVVIHDDDSAMSIVRVSDATEGVVQGTVRIVSTNTFTKDIVVPYSVAGSATAGLDYTTLGGFVTLPAGQLSVELNVTAFADAVVELPSETVVITLTESPDYTMQSTGSTTANPSATVDVFDNKGQAFITATQDGQEDAFLPTDLVYSIGLNVVVSVDTAVYFQVGSASTALSGLDFVAPVLNYAVIPAGFSTVPLVIPVLDDFEKESTETLVIQIVQGPGYSLSSLASAVGSIFDDEPTVSVLAISPIASEPSTVGGPATNGQFIVYSSGTQSGAPLARSITITYTITGTALNGVDYVALPGQVTIAAGALSATIDVTPLYDVLTEPAEDVTITLFDPVPGPTDTYDVSIPTATVNITNIPPIIPDASVTASDASAAETDVLPKDDGVVTVTLTRTAFTGQTVLVNYITSGSATSGVDFTNLTGVVGFEVLNVSGGPTAYGSGPQSLTVSNKNLLPIAVLVGTTIRMSNGFAVATVIDDPATPLVVETSYILGAVATSLPVNLTSTAGGGDAYVVTQPLNILVNDDFIVENTEQVTITLSTSPAYTVSGAANASVTIADDEPIVQVTATIPQAREAMTAAAVPGEFTVTYATLGRTTALTRPISVTATISGTALSGIDYTALTIPVIIPANLMTTTVIVNPLLDALGESPETVVMTLFDNGGPLAGTYDILSGGGAGIVTITEPVADIQVAVSTNINPLPVAQANGATVSVNSSSSTVTIRMTNPLGSANLTLGAPVLSAATGCAPVLGAFPAGVLAGASQNGTITTNIVNANVSWSFTITIPTNDPDDNPFVLTISAQAPQEIEVARGATILTSDANGTVSLVPVVDPAADSVPGGTVGVEAAITYRVTNRGTNNLSILSAPTITALAPVGCTARIISNLSVGTIASGNFADMIIGVTPTAAAAINGWACRVLIATNDIGNLPAGFAAAGTFVLTVSSPLVSVLEPEIVVAQGSTTITDNGTFSGGTIMAQASATLTYSVRNVGLGPLLITGSAVTSATLNCTAVVIDTPSVGILASGGNDTLSIVVTPAVSGAWSFNVSLPNNDVDEGSPTLDWTVSDSASPVAATLTDLGFKDGGGCGSGIGSALGLLLGICAFGGLRRNRYRNPSHDRTK